MTFDEIVARVMKRTNLTSDEAAERVGEEVNDIYREIVSSVSLETSIRSTSTATSVNGSRYVMFGGTGEDDDKVLKLMSVWLPDQPSPWNVLASATFDELRNTLPITWPPRQYAISRMGPTWVEVFLDAEATDSTSELSADIMERSITMSGDDEPNFTEDFHDVLVYGVLAIELDKMEKTARADKAQKNFERRLSDLRYWVSKDAYLRIHQGKNRWNGGGLSSGGVVAVVASDMMGMGVTSDGDEVPLLVDDDGTLLVDS